MGTTWSGFVVESVIDNGQLALLVQANITLPATTSRNIAILFFRYVDGSNHWYAQIEYDSTNAGAFNNTIFVQEVTAGVTTQRATASVTISPFTTYALTITDDGTNIQATVLSANATYASNSHNTATKVGIGLVSFNNGLTSSNAPIVDEFVVN